MADPTAPLQDLVPASQRPEVMRPDPSFGQMPPEMERFNTALELAAKNKDLGAATAILDDMKRWQQQQKLRELPKQIKLGQEGMPEAIKSTVRDQFGVASQRLAGGGSAPMIAGHAVANLLGADNDAAMQNWRSVANATPDTTGGNLVGNAAMFAAAPSRILGPAATFALGARALPRWGQVADVAATQGGMAAATTPGDASDRLIAGLTGAGAVAAPGAVGAVQTGRRMTTRAGQSLDVAEGLRRELGAEADPLIKALEGTTYPTAGIGVRPSSAMLTRNPTLEAMETGSRVRTGDQWTPLDRMNASARWKALEDAAGTPEELAKMKAARDVFTTPMREGALHGGAPGTTQVGTDLSPLNAKLIELSTGENRPNQAVQTMVNYVGSEIEKGATPAQLYTIRKSLTDGIANAPTSELSQAARAARPQRMELIGLIDDTLDKMSAGGWKQYLESYKIASPMISSKSALQKITDALSSGRAAGEVPLSMGERAAPYGFGRKVEQFGTKQFGSQEFDQLIPQHRSLVDSLLADLTAQQGVMMPRATLGSPTAANQANAGRVSQLTNNVIDAAGGLIPVGGSTVSAAVKGSLAAKNEEALARLLQNPDVLAKALRDAAKAQKLQNAAGRTGASGSAATRSLLEE